MFASRVRTAKAKRTCPECGTRFVPKGRQEYCNGRCRGRAAMRRTRERRAEAEAAADMAQIKTIVAQNTSEGIENLQWRTPNGQA
jgi:hypothetical protein